MQEGEEGAEGEAQQHLRPLAHALQQHAEGRVPARGLVRGLGTDAQHQAPTDHAAGMGQRGGQHAAPAATQRRGAVQGVHQLTQALDLLLLLLHQSLEHRGQLAWAGDPPFSRSMESTLDLIGAVPAPERGSPLSHEQLVWAARTYELAIALGRPPTKTIADRLGASLSTARVGVAQARAAGLTHVEARPGSRGGVR